MYVTNRVPMSCNLHVQAWARIKISCDIFALAGGVSLWLFVWERFFLAIFWGAKCGNWN